MGAVIGQIILIAVMAGTVIYLMAAMVRSIRFWLKLAHSRLHLHKVETRVRTPLGPRVKTLPS